MIHIKKNKEIKLDIPSFSVDDNAVGKHLNTHPLTKLLNVYGFLAIVGTPGMGKTSLAISLLTQKEPKIYRKTHHHLIVFMPQNSINSMNKNPFNKLEHIYNELTESTINEAYSLLNKFSSENEKSILFIDDMTASLKGSKSIIDTLKKIVFNRRHLHCNLIITVQTYMSIPMDLRKCISSIIMFKPSKKEFEKLFEELFESKKELFDRVMKIAYIDKHDYLFMNIASQRLFRNSDELIIDEE
jgi:GTPase SAR1 family protein